MTRGPDPASRSPWTAIAALTLGMFVLGTGEFAVVGMAVPIAESLRIDAAALGLLNSVFAAAMVIGAPVAAVVARRYGSRASIVGACALYTAANVAAALTTSLAVLFVVRGLAGLATALFSVTALASVPERQRARAVAVLLSGLTASNIAGIPLASYAGATAGWRVVFLGLGIASALVGAGTAMLVRNRGRRAAPGALGLRALGQRHRILLLLVSVAFQASVFGVFSYVALMLGEVTKSDSGTVAVVLFAYGVGTTAGLVAGGWLSDRWPWRTLTAGIGGAAVCLAAVAFAMPTQWVYGVLVLQGVVVFVAAAPINERIITMMPGAEELAAGANTAALNIGNALGPVIVGNIVVAGFPLRWVPLLGAAGLAAAAVAGLAARHAAEPAPLRHR